MLHRTEGKGKQKGGNKLMGSVHLKYSGISQVVSEYFTVSFVDM